MTYYKVFDSDLTWQGHKFEIGKTYETADNDGFSCYKNPISCANSSYEPYRVCEVTIGSNSKIVNTDTTIVSQITIGREIVGEELQNLLTGVLDMGNRIEFYKNGLLHSKDSNSPSRIWSNGSKHWHNYGKLHRDCDLPAEISQNGEQRWYIQGKLHRDGDMPAIISKDGRKVWYTNDIKQKDIWDDGTKLWYRQEMSSSMYKLNMYDAIDFSLNVLFIPTTIFMTALFPQTRYEKSIWNLKKCVANIQTETDAYKLCDINLRLYCLHERYKHTTVESGGLFPIKDYTNYIINRELFKVNPLRYTLKESSPIAQSAIVIISASTIICTGRYVKRKSPLLFLSLLFPNAITTGFGCVSQFL